MKKICIGKIATAHGVKGLVKILPFGDDASMMNGEVLTGNGDRVSITLKNKLGKYVLAEIDGVRDRDAAELLRGTELFGTRDEGKFYIEDLVGRSVVENAETIGRVIAVENFGAEDLLDISLNSGTTFYLPMRDDYVLEVGDVIIVQNHKEMIIE